VSTYAVHKVCQSLRWNDAFRERLRADPRSALEPFALTDEEREALLSGDVARLHDLGAHGLMLGYLATFGVLGLTSDIYAERIAKARSPM
jgi:hypothetical protein